MNKLQILRVYPTHDIARHNFNEAWKHLLDIQDSKLSSLVYETKTSLIRFVSQESLDYHKGFSYNLIFIRDDCRIDQNIMEGTIIPSLVEYNRKKLIYEKVLD